MQKEVLRATTSGNLEKLIVSLSTFSINGEQSSVSVWLFFLASQDAIEVM